MRINKYIFDMCMWSQNGHAACSKLQKGGFITIRDNHAQDLTGNLLTIIFKDVEIEPKLLPVTRGLQLSNCKHEQQSKSCYLSEMILGEGRTGIF